MTATYFPECPTATIALLDGGPRFDGRLVNLGPTDDDPPPAELWIPTAQHDHGTDHELAAWDAPPRQAGSSDRYILARRQTNSLRDHYGAWIYTHLSTTD